MGRKILIMGLPGAGKTTLARALAPLLSAVVFNADDVRRVISPGLGFSVEDRIEHARRMGWLCDRVVEAGGTAIADFICPTEQTREGFGEAYVIWVDRIVESRFPDTDALFEAPDADLVVTGSGSPQYWAAVAYSNLVPTFDARRPTALFVGRWQPFHDGHRKLVEEGLNRIGQACIAVRDTHGLPGNPLSFHTVKQRIEEVLARHVGRFVIVPMPNIAGIFYGRSVGYRVERIVLDADTEAISATQIRAAIDAR